ncbi:MAG: hypothetical protein ACHQIK_21075 [Candidatus Acidiferrales bacterium]
MSRDPEFKREDVEALAGELRDLKEVVREVSGKLGRIEKRLRLFFPQSFPGERRKEPEVDIRETSPTITPQRALEMYTELLEMARTGREQQVESRIAGMVLPDLALLVRELGAPLGKKPTRTALTKSLMGRLRESIMLSRHTLRPASNPPAPESEGTENASDTGGSETGGKAPDNADTAKNDPS